MTTSKSIPLLIPPVDCTYGAPMGRPDIGAHPNTLLRIFDCAVPMRGAYDKGGAYWGIGKQLRVRYQKDLKYVRFYRLGNPPPVV